MVTPSPQWNASELAQALIRCKSVTPHDGGALGVLETMLKDIGFTCHRLTFSAPNSPDIDNLYARIGTSAPHLVFAGHTDVVPAGAEETWTAPPFAAEERDGLLYGRGAVDMKGAIAAFVIATRRFIAKHNGSLPGSIGFLITGDEEGPAINGTKKLLEWVTGQGERFDHCIVGEPTNPNDLGDMIKIGRRGSLSGTITVDGHQGHVAYPHLAANPIPALSEMVSRIAREPLDQGTDHFQATNLEFTSIDVGNPAWNVIPASAAARFNIRYNDLWTPARLESWIRERLDTVDLGDKTYTLVFEPAVSDVFLTEPGPLVDVLSTAIQAVTGRNPELSTGGGTSDARFIKDYCPVIEFGLVGQTMHKIDERVPVANLDALTDIYERVIGSYFETFAT